MLTSVGRWATQPDEEKIEGLPNAPLVGHMQATGADLGRSSYLALLAEAYGKAVQIEEGLTVLAGIVTAVYENRICLNEVEFNQLKAELLLWQTIGENNSPLRPAIWAEP